MNLISKFNKGFRFLLYAIDICSKYAFLWVTNAFKKMLDESNCKPNKIWVDKGKENANQAKYE